jgi:hypothetical protein
MELDQVDNLEIFQDLIGRDAMRSVVFLTNRWSERKQSKNEKAEDVLKKSYWHKAIAAGARVERLDCGDPRADDDEMTEEERGKYQRNARRIVELILDRPATELLVQREIQHASSDTRLSDLSAGKTLEKQVERDIEIARSAGRKPEAQLVKLAYLRNTKVHDLTELKGRTEYVGSILADLVHSEPLGGAISDAVGAALDTLGKGCLGILTASAVGKAQGPAAGKVAGQVAKKAVGQELNKAYPEMFRRVDEMTRAGKEIGTSISFDIPVVKEVGEFVFGAAGLGLAGGLNAIDALRIANEAATGSQQ